MNEHYSSNLEDLGKMAESLGRFNDDLLRAYTATIKALASTVSYEPPDESDPEAT